MDVYQNKLITAEKAAALVNDGDFIAYSDYLLFPREIDEALTKRANELHDVILKTVGTEMPGFVKKESGREHIAWVDSHFDASARIPQKTGLCNYVPGTYHQWEEASRRYTAADVVFILAAPMDEHGYFNFGVCNSGLNGILETAKCVVVETNPYVPIALGGMKESIHISRVNYVVEGKGWKLDEAYDKAPTEEGRKIGQYIVEEMSDGACLQLGIGTLPTAVGDVICEAGIRDMGVHTELLTNSYLKMYKAGLISNKRKNLDKGRMVYTFALGTQELYDFVDKNTACASYPAEYTNNPAIIAQNDNVISINNALEVDLFSQVASESIGSNHISGTGGQLDFVMGAFNSKGGKSFICLNSTFKDKDGRVHSRIRASISPSTIVTLPRSLAHNIVTEYGIAQLKGKSTWGRAEALINIAHPDFREELIREAEKLKIWSYTNKKL